MKKYNGSFRCVRSTPWSSALMLRHLGHKIVVAYYGDLPSPDNVAIECEDCHEVIVDCNNKEME